jgi:hypothetical protein
MSAVPRPVDQVLVVPLSEVWKKLQQDFLAAKKALDDFKLANPVIITDIQRKKLNTVSHALWVAEKRVDIQEQNEIEALQDLHTNYITPKLVDINAKERLLKIWQLRKEDAAMTGSLKDISDSKHAFQLAYEIATLIYQMYPYFVHYSTINGLYLVYSVRQGEHFSLCSVMSLSSSQMEGEGCKEFQEYVNSIYVQIQKKERRPKS